MAKKKSVDELSRPERRGPPGPSPLLVIAGFPKSTALVAAATINNDPHSRWRAVATQFRDADDRIYADAEAIRRLGERACGFALKDKTDGEGIPAPSRIALAYIPQQGDESLWDVFGHAVWPLPIAHPDWKFPKGRHWRHHIETVNLLLRRAMASMEVGPASDLQIRIEARRPDEVMLLPGRNFHLEDGGRLIGRFRAFVAGQIGADDVAHGIRIERFPYERLQGFYARVGGRNKSFALDRRDIVFAKSERGQHGDHRQVDADVRLTEAILQRILESRYRFGTPLRPAGFQHDAQYEKDRPLKDEPFDCTIRGAVTVSGTHANIYPGDVIP